MTSVTTRKILVMRKSAWVVNSERATTVSHLRVMDHSPRFWDTVRSVVPDYAELRGQLKDEAIPLCQGPSKVRFASKKRN